MNGQCSLSAQIVNADKFACGGSERNPFTHIRTRTHMLCSVEYSDAIIKSETFAQLFKHALQPQGRNDNLILDVH